MSAQSLDSRFLLCNELVFSKMQRVGEELKVLFDFDYSMKVSLGVHNVILLADGFL